MQHKNLIITFQPWLPADREQISNAVILRCSDRIPLDDVFDGNVTAAIAALKVRV